jgi:hypothetical protein
MLLKCLGTEQMMKTHKFPVIIDTLNELKPGARRKVKKILLVFMDQIESGRVILVDKSEVIEMLRKINIILKEWNIRQTCRHPGCYKISIPYSHTLQHMGPISIVSEKGHVVTPHYDVWTKKAP